MASRINTDRPDSTSRIDDGKEEYSVRCHCGRVRGKFRCNPHKVVALDCNCSDCYMRQNAHVVVPSCDFELDMAEESLEDATILYEWGTKTAKRYFCKTCGILPWYRPRSNPDGVGLTLYCIDWGADDDVKPKPEVEIQTFNGVHWEESFAQSKISELSKSKPSS